MAYDKEKIIKHTSAAAFAYIFYLALFPIARREKLQSEIVVDEENDDQQIVQSTFENKAVFFKYFLVDSVALGLTKRFISPIEPIPAMISFTVSYPYLLDLCRNVVQPKTQVVTSEKTPVKELYSNQSFLLGLVTNGFISAASVHLIQPFLKKLVDEHAPELAKDENLTNVITYAGSRLLSRIFFASPEVLWKRRAMNQVMPNVCQEVRPYQKLNKALKNLYWLAIEETLTLGRFLVYRGCVKAVDKAMH